MYGCVGECVYAHVCGVCVSMCHVYACGWFMYVVGVFVCVCMCLYVCTCVCVLLDNKSSLLYVKVF